MHKNKLWQFLLLLIAISAIWYSSVAGYRYYKYSHLNSQIDPASISWKVAEHGTDTYTLVASYQFKIDGKTYSGSTELDNDVYLNHATAELYIDKNSKYPWKIWYDKDNPDYSSLQKDFPVKQYAYAIILWGILLYFLWLGFYITKFKT